MESSYVLCWAAKWYDSDEVLFGSVRNKKPKMMLHSIHKLLSECDAVIHYNGTKFDIPTLNKEFLLYDINPPAPYKQIDLLRVVRSQFRFPSNKLDYVAKALGLGGKVKHTGHELWVQCMAGNKESWEMMEEYNKNDVILTEQLYNKLKPWIKNHVNHGVYENGLCCTNCASINYKRSGWAYSQSNKYQRYCCKDCGTWFKAGTVNLLGEPKRFSSIT